MDRGAWLATVHGVAKSRAQLSHWHSTLVLCWKRVLGTAGGDALPAGCQEPLSTSHSCDNQNIFRYGQLFAGGGQGGDITPGGEPLTHITEIKDHDLSLALGLHRQL